MPVANIISALTHQVLPACLRHTTHTHTCTHTLMHTTLCPVRMPVHVRSGCTRSTLNLLRTENVSGLSMASFPRQSHTKWRGQSPTARCNALVAYNHNKINSRAWWNTPHTKNQEKHSSCHPYQLLPSASVDTRRQVIPAAWASALLKGTDTN